MKKMSTTTKIKLLPILVFLNAAINLIVGVVKISRGDGIGAGANILVGIIFLLISIGYAKSFRPIAKFLDEYKALEEKYVKMSLEELELLNDRDLLEGIYTRLLKETEDLEGEQELENLNDSKKVAYIAIWFHQEMLNGGLCQYFVNSSRYTAPMISSYLKLIGAEKYSEMYDKFVEVNNIKVDNLSKFEIKKPKEYSKQYEKCNFEEFDEKYYELDETDPLEIYIAKYIREHINQFEINM